MAETTKAKQKINTKETNATITRPMNVGVISLGCDKNRVDSEIMLTYLFEAGYKFTADASNADIIIINTCGFIETARNESMEAIAEMVQYRKNPKYRCKRLVVTGCLPQRWSSNILNEFPEIDIVLGIDSYPEIANILKASFDSSKKIVKVGSTKSLPFIKNRVVTTPMHYAYLKIADGCDNFCTFCTIPFIRGRYRSMDIDNLYEEAVKLVENGASELILVAQDISRYGEDKTGKPEIVKLIKKLSTIEDLKWIRLLYCYPEKLSDELLNEIINNPKVCKYIDIPLQHVSDKVLKRMNRKTCQKDIVNLLEKIKNAPEFIAIRTTYMVGFPGETDKDFDELVEFIQKYKLMHVGFFAYSKEADTTAANFVDQIPDDIKTRRLLKLMRIQQKIANEINKSFVGKTLDVCYEGIDYEKQLFFGRSQYQTPEADTLVFFKSKVPLEIGKIYKVKITKVKGYDLQGDVQNEI